MIHNQEFLKKWNQKKKIFLMNIIKKYSIKVGISLYDVSYLNLLYKIDIIQVLQIPFNIFDTRFFQNKSFKIIKKYEIHVRSIFLQGLLIRENKNFYKKNPDTEILLKNWFIWIKQNSYDSINACLNFVKKKTIVKYIIIGFKSYDQFMEIKNSKYKKIKYPKYRFLRKISDPRIWKT